MKPTILSCLLLLALPLGAEPEKLSQLDSQLLLEKLEALREGSDERIGASYKVAHAAFSSAVRSDDAAHDLYLLCVEKVQFEDEKKKAADFRDWKRRHKERVDSPAFRRALRHQLNWLLLTLQAASEPKKVEELGTKALERIDLIFNDAGQLEGEQSRLRQNVLQSVYATAYGLNGIELENWPTAPLELGDVYEQLILPPLRRPSKIPLLQSAWTKRIKHEEAALAAWARPANSRDSRPVEIERYLADRRPQLIWNMETDLFQAGDERAAALRMLAHIERFISHKNGPKWIKEFESMVKGGSAVAPVEGTKKKGGETTPAATESAEKPPAKKSETGS